MSISGKFEAVQKRLEALEENDKGKSAELNTLNRDYIAVQREMITLRNENSSLKAAVDSLRSEVTKTHITNSGLQERISRLEEEKDKLQKDVTSMRTEFNRINTLEDQIARLEELEKAQAAERQQQNADDQNLRIKKAEDDLTQLRRTFNRMIVKDSEKMDSLETKVTDWTKRTKCIEDTTDRRIKSLVDVDIDTKKPLIKGDWTKLDKVVTVHRNRGSFKTDSCCMVPETSGDHIIHINFIQEGEGQIQMNLKNDGEVKVYVGKTESHYDTSSILQVVNVKKGVQFWLEAWRCTGDANILTCNFTSWLL